MADIERVNQEQQAEANLLREKRLESERLTQFRKGLKIGSETFCGPVIEMRGPMIKIAVKFQLQGYAPEHWLKLPEIFPVSYGCLHQNGRLFPIN